MASRAFAAVARSVLYCLLDPETEREDRYLLGHPKSNLGPNQVTLRYHMIGVKLEIDDPEEPTVVTSKVVWDGQDDRTVREAMEAAGSGRPVGQLTTDLQEWITQQGRTVSIAEIIAEFSDVVERATLDQNLGRMVKRGTLYRPIRGHYAIKQPVASEASEASEASGSSDTTSDTSLERQLASERIEVSEVLTDLSLLPSDITPRARQKPKPMSQWAADLYDRE